MSQLNPAQAHLYSAIFESALYGIYLTLWAACICVFKGRTEIQTRTNKIMIATMSVMFLVASVHFAFSIRSLEEAFFRAGPNLPEQYFENHASCTNLVRRSLMLVNMMIADALLIFRLYIVYEDHMWVIILPCITTCGTAVTASLLIWNTARLGIGSSSAFFSAILKNYMPCLFVFPFITDMTVSILILVRIVRADRAVQSVIHRKTNVSMYYTLGTHLVESCIVYPAVMLIVLVLFMTKNPGGDVPAGAIVQIVSLVPAILWLQVRLGFSHSDAASCGSGSTLTSPARKPFSDFSASYNFSDMSTLALASATSRPCTPEP
ncbi:hypothetical protein EWM64_g6933 [Hericium alpestre]|uniref:G-protein coupled receptors family 1 profile domain-containing protein n=1 Tax=Hericium alpestre TaxID=135208 RepID=A0A4Y9ZTD5_9AGAM|nr:hypothetical protein EWM64_g6933 [Hericium alpestre]